MSKENYTILIAYDGNNPEYVGKATRGSSTSALVWQIKKITWSGSNPTAVKWADGIDDFTKKWADRATYSYS